MKMLEMWLLYTKPKLNDLSQGSRIVFARQFSITTRYEKGDINPKLKRLEDISSILNVSINSLREYDFNNPIDIV
jgi:transcriptional regulator with XRE-family HTH domain